MPFVLLLLAALAELAQGGAPGGVALPRLFEGFRPPHRTSTGDPLGTVEKLLSGMARFGQEVTLVAVPAFLWFSTRAFASARTALNDIFDVSLRPVHRHFLLGFLLSKLRDLTMVIATIALFLTSTTISAALALAQAWGEEAVPQFGFWVGTVGRLLGQAVAFGFIIALFLLIYRFGSTRRMRWQSALVASTFAGALFEIARRLYAFYITNVAAWNQATADASFGAIVLFFLWIYYSSFVFLLGGVVAETWELRRLQHRQRAVV
ncbi:MAG: ribonuclease [Gemmatimonadetes bacterium]|nr:ribonuclease [Gemmatimonadota bacterium]